MVSYIYNYYEWLERKKKQAIIIKKKKALDANLVHKAGL